MKKVLRKSWVTQWAARLIRVWGWSIRWKITDPHRLLEQTEREPVIFVFWHNRLFLMPYFYQKKFQKKFPQRKAVALISPSRDGEMITQIVRHFGLEVVRGSSSKKGREAFHELVQRIKEERVDVAVTPDGPRGPVYTLRPGVLYLSQLTGCAIIPVTCHYHRKKELKSWDRFQIPCLGTVGEMIFGAPLRVPAEASPEEIEKLALKLRKEMGS